MNTRNSTIFTVLGVIVVCMLLVVGCLGSTYNGMLHSSNDVLNKWADVQSKYQRRLDVVNQNLPAVIAGSQQELAVFQTLRDQAAALAGAFQTGPDGQPITPQTAEEAEALKQKIDGFDKAFINAMVYMANNPEIQSTQLYRDFMILVEGSENRISIARDDYNKAITNYRNTVQSFPNVLFAGIFGFDANKFSYFVASEEAQEAPTVVFPTPSMP